MKLRFRGNTMRLRVNQKEVNALAAGHVLREQIDFPGSTSLSYVLKPEPAAEAQAIFTQDRIQINAPMALIADWAANDNIGLYFTLPTGTQPLDISIEKDLECIDGPLEERDPNAFPRAVSDKIC